nr:MAG TPA: hypothetical protein [Caudoviricetes sp.]
MTIRPRLTLNPFPPSFPHGLNKLWITPPKTKKSVQSG